MEINDEIKEIVKTARVATNAVNSRVLIEMRKNIKLKKQLIQLMKEKDKLTRRVNELMQLEKNGTSDKS